ncbi:MAG: O-antigen ligase family protein [Lentisphaerae bacterium]|nr:O-antigen ligase family protein [Lentisphaerota bacterium]
MRAATHTQQWLQRTALWTVVVSVAVAPWLFGAAEPWAYLILFVSLSVGIGAWLSSVLTARRPRLAAPALSFVLLALLGYVGLQMAPLPAGLTGVLQPFTATLHERIAVLFDAVDLKAMLPRYAPFAGAPLSLSLSRFGTYRSMVLLTAYLGVFFVTANAPARWEQLKRAAILLLVSGFCLAVFGVIQKYSRTYEIYWFHKPRYGGDFFGPFTNRNHFAACMNMMAGIALGMFFSSRRTGSDGVEGATDRLAWLSSRRSAQALLYAFIAAIISGAACLSLSRGGMLSLALVLFVLGVVLAFRPDTSPSIRSGAAAVAMLMVAAVIWLGREAIVTRLATLADVTADPLGNQRMVVTGDALKVLGAFPLFGCGFGSFRHIFPMFQSPALEYRWLHAHNDWVQLLAEGGVVGAFIFSMAVVMWARYMALRAPGAGERARSFALGITVGVSAMAVHSFVDYSLHKPANAMLLAALCGMGVSAVEFRKVRKTTLGDILDGPKEEKPSAGAGRGTAAVKLMAAAAIVFVACLGFLQLKELRGELAFARFLHFSKAAGKASGEEALRRTISAAGAEAEIARAYARHNPDAMGEITQAFLEWSLDERLDRVFRTTLVEKAVENTAVAVQGAPSDYLNWLWFARTLTMLGEWQGAEASLGAARSLVRHRDEIRMFLPQAEPRSDL